MAHKLGKQPEERVNLHTDSLAPIGTKAAGHTTAAGFPIAASGPAIGTDSPTKQQTGDGLHGYIRRSSGLSDQSATSRQGDMPRKG